MNNAVIANEFILEFEKVYFDWDIEGKRPSDDKCETCNKKEWNSSSVECIKQQWKLDTIKRGTLYKDESEIIGYLNAGEVNERVVAWKAGRYRDSQIVMNDNNYLNGYGKPIEARILNDYLCSIKKKKENIYELIAKHKLKEAFIATMEGAPDNFGSVYIINLMFFISKGTIPIYDKFSHKAIRALNENVPPSKIYLGGSPSKKDADQVIVMYEEYIRLLREAFPSEIKNTGMFISRELDRALWVYGHSKNAKKKYGVEGADIFLDA